MFNTEEEFIVYFVHRTNLSFLDKSDSGVYSLTNGVRELLRSLPNYREPVFSFPERLCFQFKILKTKTVIRYGTGRFSLNMELQLSKKDDVEISLSPIIEFIKEKESTALKALQDHLKRFPNDKILEGYTVDNSADTKVYTKKSTGQTILEFHGKLYSVTELVQSSNQAEEQPCTARIYLREVPKKLIYSIPEWESVLKSGEVTDDDGIGYWTKEGKASKDDVFLTEQLDADGVAWFNK